jgi:hypothetical protein
VRYRVRLGEQSQFEGVIRRDPTDRDEIRVAVLSCNSSRTPAAIPPCRTCCVRTLIRSFFAGDQSYHHTQHTFGWLEWGRQFRRDCGIVPAAAIPDDHDVGHPNFVASGRRSFAEGERGSDGGFYAAEYVRMAAATPDAAFAGRG